MLLGENDAKGTISQPYSISDIFALYLIHPKFKLFTEVSMINTGHIYVQSDADMGRKWFSFG